MAFIWLALSVWWKSGLGLGLIGVGQTEIHARHLACLYQPLPDGAP